MARRPPTLRSLALRAIRDERLWTRGERVLCGCSGGADSNALLHVLATTRARAGHQLEALGVDHGLRPEAAGELDLAADIARAHGVPFHRERLSIAAGANLQARAREGRHRALQRWADKRAASAIALGHTADDRAETVLLRILRGTGIDGLDAMPPKGPPPFGHTPIARPLLAARRADVEAHLARHGLAAARDPSNADRRFLRVRVRHELLPLLEEMSPGVVGHLCALADAARSARAGAALTPPLPLNRAQRQALERVLRLRQGGAMVRIAAGQDLKVRFFGDLAVVFLDSTVVSDKT